jgi:hypothetical protein
VVNREVGGPALDTDQPLSWRVPPYQPALLMLVVCAVAALNIYGHPSQTVRAVTITLGALAAALAVLALRMYLRVDSDGVVVRYLLSPSWLAWSQIARVEIVPDVRGSETVRFVAVDGSHVDVPPSLLQPAKPTSKPRASARLNGILNQIEARRPGRAGRDRY